MSVAGIFLLLAAMGTSSQQPESDTLVLFEPSDRTPLEYFQGTMLIVAEVEVKQTYEDGSRSVMLIYPSLNHGDEGSTVLYSHRVDVTGKASDFDAVEALGHDALWIIEVNDGRYWLRGYSTAHHRGVALNWFADKPDLRYRER